MVLKVLQQVFSNVRYAIIAAPIAFAVFAFAVWLPNWRLIVTVLSSPSVSFIEALQVMFGLFLSIGTNFTVISGTYTILIAMLFGINIAMLVYYIRDKKAMFGGTGAATGIGGLVAGAFGIGCAACGTFILSALLALVGAAGVVSFLPLGGEEFGIIGVLLLSYSIYWTARKIDEPLACNTEENSNNIINY